jgi:hypothetical protein
MLLAHKYMESLVYQSNLEQHHSSWPYKLTHKYMEKSQVAK